MTLPKKRNVKNRRTAKSSTEPSVAWASRVDVTTLLAHLEPTRWFLSVLVASELFDDLREPGTWTVFVPNTSARAVYPEGALEGLFEEHASSELVDYAEHHVARGLDDTPTDSEVVLALDGYAWQLSKNAHGSLGTGLSRANLFVSQRTGGGVEQDPRPDLYGAASTRTDLVGGRDADRGSWVRSGSAGSSWCELRLGLRGALGVSCGSACGGLLV
jgi:hypothetical protein